jgi:hypothetical protein
MASISVTKIKTVLVSPRTSPLTVNDFLDLHATTEAYFRRLLYISLRLRGENDKDARKISGKCKQNSNEILDKALNFIGMEKPSRIISPFTVSNIKSNNDTFKILHKYYIGFVARHRNKYLHGAVTGVDQVTLYLIYCIELNFLKEIETLLRNEFGVTCLNTPTDWGAIRVTSPPTNTIPMRMREYRLGDFGKEPYKNNSVKKGLRTISITC